MATAVIKNKTDNFREKKPKSIGKIKHVLEITKHYMN